MIPTADQVAHALVLSAPYFDADPALVFTPGRLHTRTRTLAARCLIQARLSTVGAAATALRFPGERSVAPSMLLRLSISDDQVDAVTSALVQAYPLSKSEPKDVWAEAEDEIIRIGSANNESSGIIALKLPGRTRHAVRNRRRKLGLTPPPPAKMTKLVGVRPNGPPAPTDPEGPITAAEGWTPRRLKLLREHFQQRLSCKASAEKLGPGTTRSMVAAKRGRLGLFLPEEERSLTRALGAMAVRAKEKAKRLPPNHLRKRVMVAARSAVDPPAKRSIKAGPISGPIQLQFPKPPARLEGCLEDRILAAIGQRGALTSSSIAFFADAKELMVSQSLSLMKRAGLVEAGPVPPQGRREQRWSLAASAEAVA